MPRKVTTRKWQGKGTGAEIDAPLLGFFIDGDHKAAADGRRALGLPLLLFWRHPDLARAWREYRAEILAEAKRRGLKLKDLHGSIYDRFDRKTGDFTPQDPRDIPDYPGEPDDPRDVLSHEHEARRTRR